MSMHPACRFWPRWDAIAVAYFLGLAVAAFPPTLGAGYLLQLDMVFAPGASYLDFTLAEKGPLYYGRLPFVVALDIVTLVLSDWIVQRVILVSAVAGSGLAMYVATDDLGYHARFFAGTLYAINPFIYVRLLAGQWYIVLAYAALPLAVIAFYRYVSGKRERPTMAILWTTIVAVFDPHIAVVLALVGVIIVGVLVVDGRRTSLGRSMRFGVLAAAVNAYWLLPAAFDLLTGDSPIATIGGEDLIAFSVRGSVADNVPLSVLMLHGFWRGGYTYTFDIVPLGIAILLFAGLLFVAVYGWVSSDDPLATALAVAAILGGALAVGVASTWTAPMTALVAQTPMGAGMRETGKFVAILVMAYAILGARGVDDLITRSRDRLEIEPSWRAILIVGIVVVAVPLVYTFPMVMGFWGGFTTTEYPEAWHTADEAIESDGDHRVLVLPWHQYLYLDWAERTVANPAPMFFEGDVVSSHDPDMGTGSLATDPTRAEIRALLAEEDHAQFDEAIAAMGFEYVILLDVADHDRYAFLSDQAALQPIYESDEIVVFHNQAFATAPPPEEWPPDGSTVPSIPLGVGAAISISTIGLMATRSRTRSLHVAGLYGTVRRN